MKRSTKVSLVSLVFGALSVAAVASLAGCDDKKAPDVPAVTPPTPSAVPSAAASAAPSAAPSAVAAVEDDTPTEEDFEEESGAITEASLDSELAKLEAEIK
ncbi:MAG: hypothetical protein IPF92_16500 [Myxococcales bacterium]|nr:hypothetical protein [Myxococcales bacterium]MBL0195408.1 hypothetical protein [Myxococcales bacterium]HQY59868.1 hypothetical protein [Polyangiaceae bacterium]